MKRNAYLEPFDLDITLRDANTDLDNSPERRNLAGAAIGMDVEDAYFAAVELREAVEWVHEGVPGGKRKLSMILGNACDDYQRCLYYSLAGRGVVKMLDDLMWLEDLLEARGRVAGQLAKKRIQTMPLECPYVSTKADGPLVRADDDFEQGPSWSHDPSLTK